MAHRDRVGEAVTAALTMEREMKDWFGRMMTVTESGRRDVYHIVE